MIGGGTSSVEEHEWWWKIIGEHDMQKIFT